MKALKTGVMLTPQSREMLEDLTDGDRISFSINKIIGRMHLLTTSTVNIIHDMFTEEELDAMRLMVKGHPFISPNNIKTELQTLMFQKEYIFIGIDSDPGYLWRMTNRMTDLELVTLIFMIEDNTVKV